jgi:glutamine amidotransferase
MVFGSQLLRCNEVCIIDYGLGNLRSVENAFKAIGASARLVSRPDEILSAGRLLLPGVGSFNMGMKNLRERGLVEAICSAAKNGTPLLGICLGMQLLASSGDEGGNTQGLGLIPGRVKRLSPGARLRVPHIGFNEVLPISPSILFESISDGSDFYFVHSYCMNVDHQEDILAYGEYGEKLIVAIRRGNVYGTQFHPEKSQSQGLQLLKNFCAI